MSTKNTVTPNPKSLTAAEAEELFAKVDNSGHTDEESAERQRKRRKEKGHGVDVDPLSTDDPSGSNVGRRISRSAVIVVIVFVAAIVFTQVYVGAKRAENTANLSGNVNVYTVAEAMGGGIAWGNGFTQFPQEYSVQEADENTGRIEVSVTDATSHSTLECLQNTQIQATAFSVNSLLNPKIDTVIYHVSAYMNENGDFTRESWFGFFQPSGDRKPFVTYIWTKSTTSDGQVRFSCTMAGVDHELQELLRQQITSQAEPPFLGNGSSEDDGDKSSEKSGKKTDKKTDEDKDSASDDKSNKRTSTTMVTHAIDSPLPV